MKRLVMVYKSPDLNPNYTARHVIAVLLSVGVDRYLWPRDNTATWVAEATVMEYHINQHDAIPGNYFGGCWTAEEVRLNADRYQLYIRGTVKNAGKKRKKKKSYEDSRRAKYGNWMNTDETWEAQHTFWNNQEATHCVTIQTKEIERILMEIEILLCMLSSR